MIVTMSEMIRIVENQRTMMHSVEQNYCGPTVLLTSMPADPIHPGHISCLQNMIPAYMALMLGQTTDPNILTICIVNDDQFLIHKKGFAFIPLKDRCEIIDNIKHGPNYVVPFSPSDPMDMTVSEAIKLLKPNYFIKGGDRIADETLPEWNACQEVDCKIIDRVGAEKVWSSSNYLENYKKFLSSNKDLKVLKPWGYYRTMISNENCSVKELFIKAGQQISLQKHQNRKEVWLIVSGTGTIILGDETREVFPGLQYDIFPGELHRLTAKTDMIVSEWWIGNSSEDDIIRIEDSYGRVN